jgi:hypothetical protein
MFAHRPWVAIVFGGVCVAGAAAIACQPPPSIEGTPYGGDEPAASGTGSSNKRSNENAPSPMHDSAPSSSAQTNAAPVTTTDAGTVAPAPTTTAAPTAAPTTTSPPPATPPPSCQNADDQLCFFCCLDANPGAVPVEEAYDDCLNGCFDDTCAANCDALHLSQCSASTACTAHHACLQANGCFGPGA